MNPVLRSVQVDFASPEVFGWRRRASGRWWMFRPFVFDVDGSETHACYVKSVIFGRGRPVSGAAPWTPRQGFIYFVSLIR